jgi:predicted lipoprotein with Yx(FWY)xxD motif
VRPPPAGGADARNISTTVRTDGSTQVVYGDRPLYDYVKDNGDTTGQAVGGVWWVVGEDGMPIKTAAAPPGGG